MNIVMLGLNDPAGMMIAFSNALNRYTPHRARAISVRTLYNTQFHYDLELPRLGPDDLGEIEWLLRSADVFHFHMLMDEDYQVGPFLLRDFCKNKKLVHHHHGLYDHQCFLGKAPEYRERYRRLGRTVLVSTPDLLEQLPEAHWQPNLVPIFDVDHLPRCDHLSHSDEVRIVQAPTRTWDKHTSVFKRVTDRLSQRYPNLRVNIIQGKSHRECLAIKRCAHAVFDHMNGWFGISSLESLSHGIPVIAGLSAQVKDHICSFTGASELPWLTAHDEAGLEKTLSQLIEEPEYRLATGLASRAFMERHWTEEQALKPLLEHYKS